MGKGGGERKKKDKKEKRGGGGAPLTLAAARRVTFVPTGIVALDHMVGGGVPRGRIIEVFGPFKSGKTVLAMEIARAFQQTGEDDVAWVDAEHALSADFFMRVGIDPEAIDYRDDLDTVEGFFSWYGQWINGEAERSLRTRAKRTGVVVLDSMAALSSVHELEVEFEKRNLDRAALIGKGFRLTNGPASRAGITLVIINQVREKIGVFFGSPETTPGGKGPEYYASLRLRVHQGTLHKGKKVVIRDDAGVARGSRVIVDVKKSRFMPDGQRTELEIHGDSGIDPVAGALRLLAENGVLSEGKGDGPETFFYKGKEIKDHEDFVTKNAELFTGIWGRYRGAERSA